VSTKSDPRWIGNLHLELLKPPQDIEAVITKPFGWIDYDGHAWECKCGDIVNGASIPRFAWTVFGSPYAGRHRFAAMLHDSAYIHHFGTRKQADTMFRDCLKFSDVGKAKRDIMFRVVRAFGGHAWRDMTGGTRIDVAYIGGGAAGIA